MAIWTVERIDTTEGEPLAVAHWRLYDDARVHSIYGTTSIKLPADMATATEASIAELVKRAIDHVPDEYDAEGNLVPPDPNARKRTQEFEAALQAQVDAAAHPKTKSVKLPWVA